MRASISAAERLSITLRFLATGESYQSLALLQSWRWGDNTIGNIVAETFEAIIAEYMEEVMPCPKAPEDWKKIAEEFGSRWRFYNCIGASDGKHIAIKVPRNQGYVYYNYKGFHSIILLALVDAGHKFIFIDCGSNGSASDSGVFRDTQLFKKLENGTMALPEPEPLPNDTEPVPYHIPY
ncbi:putative nuclease HARBI1 [Eriocheir sinensis]|uniref:putative nuclease HARBI1 n=1 Tax=Eriocheir sinensis TaxID=95602 RepID=UPI0021C889EF|nr:putative nuclease HARBI1 [Eriocheir sinensis]